MLSHKSRFALGLLLALGVTGVACAQSSVANITGDAKAGDKVMVFNADTGMKREIEVQKEGRYRVRSLPTGTYSVTITHADGSIGESHSVTLRVGSTAFVPADSAPASDASAAAPEKP